MPVTILSCNKSFFNYFQLGAKKLTLIIRMFFNRTLAYKKKCRPEGHMRPEKELCVVCAWREACQKKFSLPAGRSCPDFSKDMNLERGEPEAPSKEQETTGTKKNS
ncbi:MAG: hypothetical protein LLF86_01850 [Nitrospiraceae bacterium]|nr:hypothetical protein [Nitrospiraceae bacterium]